MTRTSSLSERPGRHGPRRLIHWINPAGEREVHSLVDKVYKRKNLEVAWEKVKRNRGAGGVDGEDLAAFEASLDANLDRLHQELRDGEYEPQPVLQCLIPKAGQPGKFRPLGIPTIYDRVCQQALLNRLEPIFEPVFDDANYGYRRGRSAHGALRKIWSELDEGYEWVVDADLKDFFGSVDHEKLLELVNQRVSDGRVLGLLRQMLTAGVVADGKRLPTDRGTPQGGIVSPLLSNVLLTSVRLGNASSRLSTDSIRRRLADHVSLTRGSPRGTGRCQADTGKAGCVPERWENPNCPCQTRVRVPRLQDQAGQAASPAASLEDQERGSRGSALRGSACEIHPALQRPNPSAYPAQSSCQHAGVDRRDQPGHSGLGPILL